MQILYLPLSDVKTTPDLHRGDPVHVQNYFNSANLLINISYVTLHIMLYII
jgi:hypothetical protein